MTKPLSTDKKGILLFKRMFHCSHVRISKPTGHLFLIIGNRRHTSKDDAQWFKNGEPYDFYYIAEKVIASGKTLRELIASAKTYKKLGGRAPKHALKRR